MLGMGRTLVQIVDRGPPSPYLDVECPELYWFTHVPGWDSAFDEEVRGIVGLVERGLSTGNRDVLAPNHGSTARMKHDGVPARRSLTGCVRTVALRPLYGLTCDQVESHVSYPPRIEDISFRPSAVPVGIQEEVNGRRLGRKEGERE